MAEKSMEKEMLKSNGLRRHELLFNTRKSKIKNEIERKNEKNLESEEWNYSDTDSVTKDEFIN